MSFKIVVIDDNQLMRQSIIKTINWKEMDCYIVGQATNGVEGKNVIIENTPDIIITDIKMPGLNGLDLAAFIKPFLPHSKIIVITGYQEFEYAQKAIKIGVYDLILKPIKNEDLINSVKSAIIKIESEINAELELKNICNEAIILKQCFNESLPSLRSKAITDIISKGIIDANTINEQLMPLNFPSEKNMLLIFRPKSELIYEITKFFDSIVKISGDISSTHDLVINYAFINYDTILLILFKNTISAREAKDKIKNFLEYIENTINAETLLDYSVAISSLYCNLCELFTSYKEAFSVIDKNFFESKEKVVFAGETKNKISFGMYPIFNDLEEFYSKLEELTKIEMSTQIKSLLEKISQYSNGKKFIALSLIAEVCITISRYYFRTTGIICKDAKEILEEVSKLKDMSEAFGYLNKYILCIKDNLVYIDRKYSPIVKKVVEFINKNYNKDISLGSVAEQYSISPCYLSRIIKKETGENFLDLLTKTKVNAAKRLLKDPQYKIYEVAEKVGYTDYSYFYQVFKKSVGISPLDFKKMN